MNWQNSLRGIVANSALDSLTEVFKKACTMSRHRFLFETKLLEARDLPSGITPRAPSFRKSKISPTQMANLQELVNDLTAIHSQSDATAEQQASFFQSGAAVLDGAVKPSSASVSVLATDYKLFSADGSISEIEKKMLDKDVDNVLASVNIPRSEWNAFVDVALELYSSSNVEGEQLQDLKADFVAVIDEFYIQHSGVPQP